MPEATARDPRLVSGSDYGNPDPEWRRVDWRQHLRRVQLPGAEVNYLEIGEGEPIVFVHGISGCWQNWLENLPHFARGRRVIALDLPGFGASPMPSWPIDMPAYGRLLNDFCEKLGVENAVLVGNSMGGLVAIEACTTSPTRFDRLVLVSSAGILNTWQPQPRATATAWAWKHIGPHYHRRGREIVTRPRARQIVFGPFIRYPSRLRGDLLLEQMDNGLRRADGFGDALQSVIETDIREQVGRIELPTLVIGGLSDRVVPVAAAVSLHRRISHSRLEIFERTGHVPQLERPLRFNAVVEEFLTS
ncbi:MAG TPA: alpha/beta fold hydrolase [Solirubrobacterales bacterium]|jgi:pimeloyl-ACP methyl ester carboxylesterase|nr:alpha/beta fold hydrolase [Solirubrobacterales bacterium]